MIVEKETEYMNEFDIVDKLEKLHSLDVSEYLSLISTLDIEVNNYLNRKARELAWQKFKGEVRARGLIEISNYCHNNCLYCGIRAANLNVERYRLSKKDILDCCEQGDKLGFQTFVLQGGEDVTHTVEWVEYVVRAIRVKYPNKAITLSLGERSRDDYQRWFDAGADRYLLRHETIVKTHYEKLHPNNMSFTNRLRCLRDLKEIGYETGTGIMVGSPYQKMEYIAQDLKFIEEFQPEMIGIGPFVSHHDTPFRNERNGSVDLTIRLISILRLMHPNANIPATTSLGTLASDGRERGILAGANVVMPNLSPVGQRRKYALYDNKICMDEEAAESRYLLEEKIRRIGYHLV